MSITKPRQRTRTAALRVQLRVVRDGERAQAAPVFPSAPKLRLDEITAAAEAFADSDTARDMIADLSAKHGENLPALLADLVEYGFTRGAYHEMAATDTWMSRYEGIRLIYGVQGVTA